MDDRPRFDSQTGEPIHYDDNKTAEEYSYYNIEPEPEPQKTAAQLKKERKAARKAAKAARNATGNHFFKKAAALVLSAVVFGGVAGGMMYGVNYAAGKYFPPQTNPADVQIPTVELPSGIDSENVISNYIQSEDKAVSNTQMNVKEVIKAAMPSIVAITGTKPTSGGYSYPFGSTQEAQTSGTGIIVGKNDTELLIVTNAHVVDGVNNLTCVFNDDTEVSASVKGSKPNKDIAVVAVRLSDIKNSSTLSSIAIATLGDSDSVEVGDQVVCIGNALGNGQAVTVGYVSALNRSITIDGTEYSNLIMTNAAINPGNSGGAMLDANGHVIGINSAKQSSTEVEGMGYAIPISSIKDILDTLMTHQTRSTKVDEENASYLGISGVDITSSIASAYGYPQGVLIQSVVSGSAADKAGLSKGDILVGFDDNAITSFSALKSLMQYYEAGETVTLEYYHQEKDQYKLTTTDVVLGSKVS